MIDLFNILEIIKPLDKIIIAGHINPDGDAIGACFALSYALKQLGRNPKVFLGDYGKKFNIIPGRQFLVSKPSSCDVFISLDCGSIDRLPIDIRQIYEEAKVTINIDHHSSNNNFAMYNYVVADASSTCELIFDVIGDLIMFEKNFATAIYAGIIYDTGGLRFKSTTAKTLSIVSKMMETGIDYTTIYNDMILKNTKGSINAIKRTLDNIEFIPKLKLCMTYITKIEMEQLNIKKDDLDNIVQFILNIEDIEIAVFIYETEHEVFKVSFRSIYQNVNEVAQKFGGGGHINAAGCTIRGTKDQVYNIIKNYLCENIL